MGILFREIVKLLALRNIRGFNFHKYVACLVLRPVADKVLRFIFHECRLTREIREN